MLHSWWPFLAIPPANHPDVPPIYLHTLQLLLTLLYYTLLKLIRLNSPPFHIIMYVYWVLSCMSRPNIYICRIIFTQHNTLPTWYPPLKHIINNLLIRQYKRHSRPFNHTQTKVMMHRPKGLLPWCKRRCANSNISIIHGQD